MDSTNSLPVAVIGAGPVGLANLDPVVEAPVELGPLIDPEFHSCGTVPETGVSSADAGTSREVPATGTMLGAASVESGCCGTPEPVLVGFPTGLTHGRSGIN
jgi:hypothetical protein